MVEVYSTDIINEWQADFIVDRLHEKYPNYKINFDLEDCDNILRVEGSGLSAHVEDICAILKSFGFSANVLDDEPCEVAKELDSKTYR